MWKYRWEVYKYNVSVQRHVKCGDGVFEGTDVIGMFKKMATHRATIDGEMIPGEWVIEKMEKEPGQLKGRVYKKQDNSKPYSPFILLFVEGEV